MSFADRERWDLKHSGSGPTEPSAALLRIAERIPRRARVLDLACGRGANALYLAAQRDCRVDAVDISIVALRKLREIAAREGLTERIQPLQVDLDLPALRTDVGHYDAITITSFLDRALFSLLPGLLRPCGLLFIDTFDRGYLAVNPRFSPQFVLESEELIHAFPTFEILHHSAADGRTCYLGRKPGAEVST